VKRFLKAAIGWIRYKPLLTYITNKENYNDVISQISESLKIVTPKFCDYFQNAGFNCMLKELEYYHSHVEQHFEDFYNTRQAWIKVMNYLGDK
jgi:hypothetical protein